MSATVRAVRSIGICLHRPTSSRNTPPNVIARGGHELRSAASPGAPEEPCISDVEGATSAEIYLQCLCQPARAPQEHDNAGQRPQAATPVTANGARGRE